MMVVLGLQDDTVEGITKPLEQRIKRYGVPTTTATGKSLSLV